jgi:hypothetical protein
MAFTKYVWLYAAFLISVTTVLQESPPSKPQMPSELIGTWRLESIWNAKDETFAQIQPTEICIAKDDSIKLLKPNITLKVSDILTTPPSDTSPVEKRMIMLKSNDNKTVVHFRVQSNNRGTWMLQIYEQDTESLRCQFKVIDQHNRVVIGVIGDSAVTRDPALGYRWVHDSNDLTSNDVDDMTITAKSEVDETLFLLYVLNYSFQPIDNTKDLSRIASIVAARDSVVSALMPYVRAKEETKLLADLFDETHQSCAKVLATIEVYANVKAGRDNRIDDTVTQLELDMLADLAVPALELAIEKKPSAILGMASSALGGLARAARSTNDFIKKENNLTEKMNAEMEAVIRSEAEVRNKIRAIASLIATRRGWGPGESGWNGEPPSAYIDTSSKDALRLSIAKIDSLMKEQPRNPFLRAEYNKLRKRLEPEMSYEQLMRAAAFSLDSARLVPDGDIYSPIKLPFIEYAVDRIEEASDLIVAKQGGWGAARTYNGFREFRVLHAWSKIDRADISGKIRTHLAWAYADIGNLPEAVKSLKEIVDLMPMDDQELFYRTARLRSIESPAVSYELLKVAIEIGGDPLRVRARTQPEFKRLSNWNRKAFESLTAK